MSVENLKAYARRCATEPELRAAARELGASDVDGHIRHAAGLGLDWSEDDMLAFRKEVIDASGDDYANLTEEELEQVAGGAVLVGVAIAAVVAAATGAVVAGGIATGTAAGVTAGSGW